MTGRTGRTCRIGGTGRTGRVLEKVILGTQTCHLGGLEARGTETQRHRETHRRRDTEAQRIDAKPPQINEQQLFYTKITTHWNKNNCFGPGSCMRRFSVVKHNAKNNNKKY